MFTAYYSKPFGIQLPSLSQYCDALHCTVLHCSTLYYTVLHCIVLHCFTLYYIVLYCTVLHCTLPASSVSAWYWKWKPGAFISSSVSSLLSLLFCIFSSVSSLLYLLFCLFSSVSSLLSLIFSFLLFCSPQGRPGEDDCRKDGKESKDVIPKQTIMQGHLILWSWLHRLR